MSWLKKASEEGLRWPFVHDPVSKAPSVTLLFTYVSFVLATIIVIALSIKSLEEGAIAGLSLWTLSTIFYLLRRLTKAKLDLDDKSIELEGDENDRSDKE